nr:galactokinase [Streptococcus thermophilus]
MPEWTADFIPASQRAVKVHHEVTGADPLHTADAPGTFIVAGENADHFGGITIAGLAWHRAAVAVSPRTDDTISVHAEFCSAVTRDTATTSEVAELAESPEKDSRYAVRFGGLVHTFVGRQMLSRETAGMNITVVSDIPLGSGLGALHAADAALGLALLADDDEIDAAPLRTRIAEIASQSAKMFSPVPVLRARHSAALRGAEDSVCVIDYSDGSLTQAPHPNRADMAILSIAAPSDAPFIDEAVTQGRTLIDEACANFGVPSLRQLPDAVDRVVEWVEARRQVYGADSAPTPETARAWVTFSEAETQQAAAAAKALRSMRIDDFFAVLDQPLPTPGLSVPDQLIQLLELRGVTAARPAAAGMSQAVLAYLPVESANNAIADLSEDGLDVVAVQVGTAAKVLS